MPLLSKFLVFCCVGLALTASNIAEAGVKSPRLNMRQPTRGISVQRLVKQRTLQSNLDDAKRWADALDAQSMHLLHASTKGSIARWMHNIDLESMQNQYSENVMLHLKALASALKIRREVGSLSKLREFDFQNTIRKSDYLMSLPVTKEIFKEIQEDPRSATEMAQILKSYNYERNLFDKKIIVIAKK